MPTRINLPKKTKFFLGGKEIKRDPLNSIPNWIKIVFGVTGFALSIYDVYKIINT